MKEKVKEEEIASINPSNMTYNSRITFNSNFENKKVLLINEVDKNFPLNNNLISFIDKSSALMTEEGYKIENNFELIVINSVFSPEEVFGYLGKRIASQVLRRIYEDNGSEVYTVKKNVSQLKRIKKKQTK